MSSRAIIAFRNKLIEADTAQSANNPEIAASLNHELMRLGYILSKEAFDSLSRSSTEHLTSLYGEVIAFAKYIKNSGRYSPLWKNFPNDVMSVSSSTLYMVAIAHYWTHGRFSPDAFSDLISVDRKFEYEHKTFTTINLARGNWLQEIANNLASFTKPLDPQSIEDLKYIVSSNPGIELPVITVRETLAVVAANGGKVKVKNPTDVLRVAVAMSGGDVSLSALPKVPKHSRSSSWAIKSAEAEVQVARDAQKFKKFSRAERKMLLGMLEGLKYLDAGDLQPYVGRWTRLGEVLHPGEYAKQFPRTASVFAELRNQKNGNRVRTFAGKVDMLFKTSEKDAIELLATRPGEFARRLDALLRSYKNDFVLKTFEGIASGVSTKTLFEMYDHFEGRRTSQPRMVMIKGAGASSRVLEDLPPLDKTTIDRVQKIIKDQMFSRAAALPKMGSVFIDPELFNIPVPYSMQSSSEGASTLVRGTRTPINPETKVLRAYQFWHDTAGSIDLDLAAAFLNANFGLIAECAFYDLSQGGYAYHSGDIRHRRGKNAEFIDVDLEKARKHGVKYILFNVYNYNGRPIADVKDAAFGIMERSKPKSNEIFDPATSSTSIKTTAKSTAYNPAIIDLVNNQWVWLDLENNAGNMGVRFASQDIAALQKKLAAVLGNVKFSVADLLMLHANARGAELVDTPTAADVSFTMEDLSTSYTKLAPFMAI